MLIQAIMNPHQTEQKTRLLIFLGILIVAGASFIELVPLIGDPAASIFIFVSVVFGWLFGWKLGGLGGLLLSIPIYLIFQYFRYSLPVANLYVGTLADISFGILGGLGRELFVFLKNQSILLEERVDQRTKELDQKNRKLEQHIFEQQQTEEALRWNQSQLQNVIASAPVILLTIDQHGQLTLAEGKSLESIPFSPEEILEKILYQSDYNLDELFELFKKQQPYPVDTNQIKIAGRVFEASFSTYQHNTSPQNELLITLVDITEQVQYLGEQNFLIQLSSALQDTIDRDGVTSVSLKYLRQLDFVNQVDIIQVHNHNRNRKLVPSCGEIEAFFQKPLQETPLYTLVLKGKEYLIQINELGLEVPDTQDNNLENRSVISTPITAHQHVLGAIVVITSSEITTSQVNLMKTLSEMIASSYQKADLFENSARKVNQLSSLHTIDRSITGNMQLEEVLPVILEQVVSQLKVDAAAILQSGENWLTFRYKATTGFKFGDISGSVIQLNPSPVLQSLLNHQLVSLHGQEAIENRFGGERPAWREQFKTYFGVPLIAKGEIQGILEVYLEENFRAEWEWINFLNMIAGQTAIAMNNLALFQELQRTNVKLEMAYNTTLEGWARALELRDMETEGHSRRVTDLVIQLAVEMGIENGDLVHIRRGALLHDIGKISIPDSILLKPGQLDESEWALMRRHPTLANDLLSSIDFLKPALDIPHYHHERWDGSGYPNGLKGKQIPLAARIFAIVDVWDALLSNRPYRKAWTREKALAHIHEQAGKHFDPQVVEAFQKVLDEEAQEM